MPFEWLGILLIVLLVVFIIAGWHSKHDRAPRDDGEHCVDDDPPPPPPRTRPPKSPDAPS